MKELPGRSKGALYVAFTAMGLVGGYMVKDVIEETHPAPIVIAGGNGESYDPERPDYQATMARDVRNALFPSPSPTNTPYPTATGTVDPMSGNDFCTDSSKKGDLCRVPYPDPPTPTPYLSCDSGDLSAGDWCVVGKGVAGE